MGPGRGGSAPARGESQEEAAAPPGASPGPGSFARQLCAAEQRLQLSLLPAELPRGKGDLGLGGTGACPRMGMRGCGRPRRQRGAGTLPCPQVGCAPGRGGPRFPTFSRGETRASCAPLRAFSADRSPPTSPQPRYLPAAPSSAGAAALRLRANSAAAEGGCERRRVSSPRLWGFASWPGGRRRLLDPGEVARLGRGSAPARPGGGAVRGAGNPGRRDPGTPGPAAARLQGWSLQSGHL